MAAQPLWRCALPPTPPLKLLTLLLTLLPMLLTLLPMLLLLTLLTLLLTLLTLLLTLLPLTLSLLTLLTLLLTLLPLTLPLLMLLTLTPTPTPLGARRIWKCASWSAPSSPVPASPDPRPPREGDTSCMSSNAPIKAADTSLSPVVGPLTPPTFAARASGPHARPPSVSDASVTKSSYPYTTP